MWSPFILSGYSIIQIGIFPSVILVLLSRAPHVIGFYNGMSAHFVCIKFQILVPNIVPFVIFLFLLIKVFFTSLDNA